MEEQIGWEHLAHLVFGFIFECQKDVKHLYSQVNLSFLQSRKFQGNLLDPDGNK